MSADTHRPGLLAEYLTEAELAGELKKDERTLQRWRKQRRGPPYILNGETPLYHRPGTAQWLASGGTAGPKGRTRGRTR
jgi:hypothetical protein